VRVRPPARESRSPLPPRPARDPAAGAAWSPAAAAALAGLLLAGLTEAQLSHLADLRVRARRGAFAADGYAGPTP
jgi:hypothetical protein